MANRFKDTLLIGKTEFSMRAGLATKEPEIQEMWKNDEIYQEKLKRNEDRELFMLHDGPPYANGDLHIGHSLNKTLKDFIIRWKNSNGYKAPFIMGWDTHGLPIESAVTKTGIDRKTMDPVSFRELCKEYALKQVDNQSNQFRRLGMFTDYNVKYLTLYPSYEVSELRLFERMYNEGLIYKALKPIYWSPSSESALAESEVEYQDVKSPTIFVAADLEDNDFLPKGTQVIIWTTTPWTLPTNQLIAVGERMEYSLVKVTTEDKEHLYVVATDLVEKLTEQLSWENVEIIKTFKGKELEGINYVNPLYNTVTSKIVLGHHVTAEAGTGLVHIAGGFGEDDYIIAKNNGLEPYAPIDNQGNFTVEINDEELQGKFYDDTNKIITTRLKESGKLLKLKFVSHSYPHDWRTKKPVIYRATLQWFIGVNKAKEQILGHVNKVVTNPKWAKQRLYQVLDDRSDWTISRQRLWGVPIIGFYDENDLLVLNSEILNFAITKIEELGTNAWFSEPADTFLPEEYRGRNLRKEKDILDVWFDSGSSAIALQDRFPELKRPFDVYLEGNDQYRGWFNASMINSVIYDDKSPYKQLISHGMTTDEKGKKMSKSLGNGIDPIEFANTSGSDVLRLWVSSTDYTDDQRIGDEIIKQVSESYRKIRNTLRFIMANLFDFDENKNYQKELESVDKYALHQLTVFKNKAIESFDNYRFNEVYTSVVNYVTKDLSSFYLDFIKDIVYVDGQDSLRRRQVQTVLYEILWALIDILRPIIPHTIEEAYQSLDWLENKEKSVHLLDIKNQNFLMNEEEITLWNNVMELRDEVNKSLEISREQKIINKGFEAEVDVELKPEFSAIKNINDLATIFIVSKLNFVDKINSTNVEGKIANIDSKARVGEKCERCWGIYDELTDGLCGRCSKVVNELK